MIMRWEQVFQTYSPEQKEFFLKNMPKLLAADSMIERYCEIVTDFDFIKSKVVDFGPQGLIEDYDYSLDNDLFLSEIKQKLGEEFVEALGLIQSAIRLSSHILETYHGQIASQLWGRLKQENQIIKKLLDDVKKYAEKPWLRPLTSSMINANSPLIRIIDSEHSGISSLVSYKKTLVSGGRYDKSIMIWDLDGIRSGDNVPKAKIDTENGIYSMSITPDGKTLVSGSDKSIMIWDLDGIRSGDNVPKAKIDTENGIYSMSITPDGKTLVSGSDKSIMIWDLDGIRSGDRDARIINGAHIGAIVLAITPDGKTLVSGGRYDKSIMIWDLDGIRSGDNVPKAKIDTENGIYSMSITPDGKTLVSGSDKSIMIWDLDGIRSGDNVPKAKIDTENGIYSMSITPDGKTLVSGSDKSIMIWDLDGIRSGDRDARIINGAHIGAIVLAITPDGKTLVSGGRYDKSIMIWDLNSLRNESNVKPKKIDTGKWNLLYVYHARRKDSGVWF